MSMNSKAKMLASAKTKTMEMRVHVVFPQDAYDT